MMTARNGMVVGVLLLLSVACSQRVTPEDEYDPSDRERPLVQLPASVSPSAGPATAGGSATSGGPAISGEIVGSGDVEVSLRAGVVFLFIRPAGQEGGPPLAVQRHAGVTLPFAFSIGAADAMIPGVEFPDRVTVSARVDADGDPLTSSEDDWLARSEPVSMGASGVILDLRARGS